MKSQEKDTIFFISNGSKLIDIMLASVDANL